MPSAGPCFYNTSNVCPVYDDRRAAVAIQASDCTMAEILTICVSNDPPLLQQAERDRAHNFMQEFIVRIFGNSIYVPR